MKAGQIINLLEKQEYDKLRLAAEKELRLEAAKQKGGITEIRRQQAAEKLLSGGSAWDADGCQCFSSLYIGFMLSNTLNLPMRNERNARVEGYFRSDPGTEVGIDWQQVYIEREKNKARRSKNRVSIVKVENVHVNVQYLIEAKKILGGNELKVYCAGELDTLQLESENGRAFILPIRYGSYNENPVVCVSKPVAVPSTDIA